MSSTKTQSSWQEDIVRNFSRLFSRSKSEEQEQAGSDENVSSSSAEVPDLSSPLHETQKEGQSLEPVQDLSKAFGGSRGDSVLADAGGSSWAPAPRPPAGPAPATPTPSLDAFFRKLGSLFLSPAKAEERADGPGPWVHRRRQQHRQATEAELDPGPAGMTWVSVGSRETRDLGARLQEGAGTRHPLREGSEDTEQALAAGDPVTERGPERTVQEYSPAELQDQQQPYTYLSNVAGEDDYIAHEEGAEGSQPSQGATDEHRRLALTCPPVVTYGTYRGLRGIERMRKRHEAQAGPLPGEAEEQQGDSTHAKPSPPGTERDSPVSEPRAAAGAVDSCQKASGEVLERDMATSAGPPVTPSVLGSALPEDRSRQSALPGELEPSVPAAWDQVAGAASGAALTAPPLFAADEGVSDTLTRTRCPHGFGETEGHLAESLGDEATSAASVHRNEDAEAEKGLAESASSQGCSSGEPFTVGELSPALATSPLRGTWSLQLATQMGATSSAAHGSQASQSCMSPSSSQKLEGPECPVPRGRSAGDSDNDSVPARAGYLEDVSQEQAFHSESKLLVSRILENALTALEKIEPSEHESREPSVDVQACPAFPTESEEGMGGCFQPACLQEESFVGLGEDNFLPVPVEHMTSNRTLTDVSRSSQSSGYQSIVGSDTDIRISSGLACELCSPVSPPDHRQKEQFPVESEILESSLEGNSSIQDSNGCLKELYCRSAVSNMKPTIQMEEKEEDAHVNKSDVISRNAKSDASSGTLLEKQSTDGVNGDIIHQVNVLIQSDGLSERFTVEKLDNAQVNLESQANGFNRELSTTSGEAAISTDLPLAKEPTESNRQFYSASRFFPENVLPVSDVLQLGVTPKTQNERSVKEVETEIAICTGLGNEVDAKLDHREGEEKDISGTADVMSKSEPSQSSEEPPARLGLKDGATRKGSSDTGDSLIGDGSIMGDQQEPHDTLSSGSENYLLGEGHSLAVAKDEAAFKNDSSTCQQTVPGDGSMTSKGDDPGEWGRQESHALEMEARRSNEGRQQWSGVNTHSCDLPVEQRHASEMLGHGAGMSPHGSPHSRTHGFNILGKKVQPDLFHRGPRSEVSGHYLHRFQDMEFHEGEGGISIIDEEEETDAVFVNDTGVALSPTSRRGKVYPFSLSPIYEEEGNREEAGTDDIQEPSVMEEDAGRAEQSILSLLQSVSERLQSSVLSDSCQEPSEDLSALRQRPSWDCDEDDEGAEAAGDGHDILMGLNESQSHEFDPADSLHLADCVEGTTQAKQVSPLQEEMQVPTGPSEPVDVSSTPFYEYIRCARSGWPLHKPEEREARLMSFLCQDTVGTSVSPAADAVKESAEKVIPRPTQIRIFDGLDSSGEGQVVQADVEAASGMVYLHGASVRVVRGCWLLYREHRYQGPCVALEEGEAVLTHTTCLASPENGATAIVIGSLRRAVKDDRVPEIQLQPLGGTPQCVQSEASSLRDLHLPSLCVRSGCWLAYGGAGFTGSYTVLEAGRPPVAGHDGSLVTHVRSLRPLRMGGLKVWRPMDPKMVLYEKSHFRGRSVKLESNALHVDTLPGLQGAASLRVISGVWVGYSKEGYRGRQYLLEEGEYRDFTELGGSDLALLSFRFLQGDFIEPSVTLREAPDLPNATETDMIDWDVPDLEPAGPARGTASICVRSGLWVVYSEPLFCGEQHVLERGTYTGLLHWSSWSGAARSMRPIRLELWTKGEPMFLLRAYGQPHYQGESREYGSEVMTFLPFTPTSFRVVKGSWLLFDEENCAGNQFVLGEGHYPDLISCGCGITSMKSLRPIPYSFADPSISLYSLDCFEGLENVATMPMEHMDGFFTQSLRVNSGTWVLYEYAGFKGRQMLLGPGDVTSWAHHTGWDSVGSLHPLKQPKVFVRVRSRCLGSVLTAEAERSDSAPASLSLEPDHSLDTQLWVFSGGLLKAKVTKACLSVIGGKATPGARVALWPEHGRAHQRWSLNEDGTISSHLSHSLVLDLKGGCGFDRNHLVTSDFTGDRQTQYWDIEVV